MNKEIDLKIFMVAFPVTHYLLFILIFAFSSFLKMCIFFNQRKSVQY